MNSEAKNLGKNIRALRFEKGWTQHDLALKVASTQKTITAYECGTRHPTAEKIPVIAAVFGVTVNELYGASYTKKREKTKNPKLWKKFELIDHLPNNDKRTVFRMIDGLLAQRKPASNALNYFLK
jgi:transcriptional regulator with XRE-family HTH domain